MDRRRRAVRTALAGAGIAAVLGGGLATANAAPAAATPHTTGNLLVNGDAEASLGRPVPGWTLTTGTTFEAQAYGQGGFPLLTDPGPANRGAALFAGGIVPVSQPDERLERAVQTRSLTKYAASIDAGTATFALAGWLGGYNNQRDNATLTALFFDATNAVVGRAMIGPVTPSQRQLQTGLLRRASSGPVPVGTRKVTVQLVLHRLDGSYNDGYADNLTLTVTTDAP